MFTVSGVAIDMPHKEDSNIVIKPLHPTFAAEVQDVDFTEELTPEIFLEISAAIAKVSQTVNLRQKRQTKSSICDSTE